MYATDDMDQLIDISTQTDDWSQARVREVYQPNGPVPSLIRFSLQ